MGNSSSSRKNKDISSRATAAVGEGVRELQANLQDSIKKLEEEDHPAAQILDTLCSPYLDGKKSRRSRRNRRSSFDDDYDDDYSDEDESYDESRTQFSDEETTETEYYNRKRRSRRRNRKKEEASYVSTDGYESSTVDDRTRLADDETATATQLDDETAEYAQQHPKPQQPLASSFAKRCYFTKSGIGGQTQHYEGLTLTGNVVLMLALAMKLKGCPTICDEDLRRVEAEYPNQFSRLPDELLLSSGWRRISKFCHFSNKPIPDGVPFFRKFASSRMRDPVLERF